MDSSRAKTPSRLLLTVAFTLSALLLGIIGAVAAGTGTVTPPPKIAFVTTNANVAPDALTVGPMAGRLGAPLFITNKDALGDDTKDALVAYGADLIIVAGGPGTITDGVLAEISAATGKAIAPENSAPASGIVRVYGSGRDQTAVALSTLIAKYNPKFLPTDATAADADLLDGKDSTAFLGKTEKAADADKLDGFNSSDVFSVPLLPGEAHLDGDAVVIDGFASGISMPDGGAAPQFGWTVQLPADFPSGGTVTATLLYSSAAGACTFDLSANSDGAYTLGTGVRKNPTLTAPGSISGTGSINTIGEFTFTVSGAGADALEPGDLVWMGLFRSLGTGDDTCAGGFTIHGGELSY